MCYDVIGKVMLRARKVIFHVIYVKNENHGPCILSLGKLDFILCSREFNPSRTTCSE